MFEGPDFQSSVATGGFVTQIPIVTNNWWLCLSGSWYYYEFGTIE